MRALSIRQPYAEQILRGVKTIEYRSRPTKIVGQRFYIYAAQKWAGRSDLTSRDHEGAEALSRVGTAPLADARGSFSESLPTGVIVGSAVISHCTNGTPGLYHWHLKDVRRYKTPRKVKRQPQPVWFKPF
jgi:hypothetical protein